MRLSRVFELLLIFLFIAFAASRHVGKKSDAKKSGVRQGGPTRYCSCNNLMCNCCRDFSLPVVSIKGPGCAAISYQNGDAMRLTMTFGNRVLRNITLSGRRPRPVCMSLPGGISKFCGRIYGIERDGDQQFRACLALELRALDDVEAALRVSCFKFGPNGVRLEPGRPVPISTSDEDDDDDDDYDDDDDDDFDLDDDDEDDSAENDVDSTDYEGFSVLGDDFLEGFFGGSSGDKKKQKVKPQPNRDPVKVTAAPVKVTAAPVKVTAAPVKVTPAPVKVTPAPVKKGSTTPAPNKKGTTPKKPHRYPTTASPTPAPSIQENVPEVLPSKGSPIEVSPAQDSMLMTEIRPPQDSLPMAEVRPAQDPMTEVRPAQDSRPMTELRPEQDSLPMSEVRPVQDSMTEIRPAQDSRPMTEVHPAQDASPMTEVRPAQDIMALTEVLPAQDSITEVRPAQDTMPMTELRPVQDSLTELRPAQDSTDEVRPAQDSTLEVRPAQDSMPMTEDSVLMTEVRPAQDSVPTSELRPVEDSKPMSEIRPAQESMPASVLRPEQDSLPMAEVGPAQDSMTEARPVQDSMTEARPAQDSMAITELRPVGDSASGEGAATEVQRPGLQNTVVAGDNAQQGAVEGEKTNMQEEMDESNNERSEEEVEGSADGKPEPLGARRGGDRSEWDRALDLYPGLRELVRSPAAALNPPPPLPYRTSRTHRRMRLPPQPLIYL